MNKYFDYAASCPIDEEALQTYMKASREYFGNSTSLHDEGTKASRLVEHCRETLAQAVGVDSEGIYFTSGGSEGNFLALQALRSAHKGNHMIISEGEHSSVHNVAAKFAQEGVRVTKIPFTPQGIIDLEAFKQVMTEETAVVSIHHVNSEVGAIQPMQEIARICRKNGTYVHSDCVQSFGKLDVSELANYVDSMTVSSHKVYGPKGVGAVYVDHSIPFQPFLPNSVHESGVRPGTINVPGIAAFTVAVGKCTARLKEQDHHSNQLKQEFMNGLVSVKDRIEWMSDVQVSMGVPIVGLCVRGVEGQWLMLEGNRQGFSFSTGSACQVGQQKPSRTLLSMGKSEEEAKTFIRVSFGRDHTREDVMRLANWLTQTIEAYSYPVVQ